MIWALLAPDLVCVLCCLVAAVTDLRSRTIPNWLTLTGILVGLLLNTVLSGLLGGGWVAGFLSAFAGSLLLLIVFGLLGLVSFVGMGDVKLMAAVGACLRWPLALWALAYVAFAGGVIAVVYALWRGRLGQVLGNLGRLGKRVIRRPGPDEPAVELHRIPYALAILAGTGWAVLARYLPALRLP
jgi:prepilin peptidase CpaA